MRTKQLRVIKCPNCGCEYLPAEIYYPKDFLGAPANIMKDRDGKIIGFDKCSMNDTEIYECDVCMSKFEVTCTSNFTSKLCGKDSTHHVTKLSTDKLFMEEN